MITSHSRACDGLLISSESGMTTLNNLARKRMTPPLNKLTSSNEGTAVRHGPYRLGQIGEKVAKSTTNGPPEEKKKRPAYRDQTGTIGHALATEAHFPRSCVSFRPGYSPRRQAMPRNAQKRHPGTLFAGQPSLRGRVAGVLDDLPDVGLRDHRGMLDGGLAGFQ